MKSLFLLVNSTCDISCAHCFYTTGHEKRSRFRVKPEMANLLATRVAELGFTTVILTGGDPLHSRFKHETFELIRELKDQGCRVIINTSAAYLDEDDLDKIIELEVDRVDLSIDSHQGVIHDAQRGRHSDVVSVIKGLVSRGYRNIATTTVVTDLNASSLEETLSWLREIGVQDVRIQRVFLPYKSDDVAGIMDAMRSVESLLDSPHARKYIELTERAFDGENPPVGARCQMGKDYFVCNAQGELTPCFHRDDISLGNIFDDTASVLHSAMDHHELIAHVVPPCFGGHCASLFDIPTFWSKKP